MDMKRILQDYLDMELLQQVLSNIDPSSCVDQKSPTSKVIDFITDYTLTKGIEDKRKNLRYIFDSMKDNSIKALLIEEGIPPNGSREELFERFLFCMLDEDDEIHF